MARRTKKRQRRGTRINNKHNRAHQSNKRKVTQTGKRNVMTGGHLKSPNDKKPLNKFPSDASTVIAGLPPVNRGSAKNFVLHAPKPGAVEIAIQAFLNAARAAQAPRASPSLVANPLKPNSVAKFEKPLNISYRVSVSNPIIDIYGAKNPAATVNPGIKASNADSLYTPMDQSGVISNPSYNPNPEGNPNNSNNSNPVYMEVGIPTYKSADFKRNPNDRLPPVPNVQNPIHVPNPIYESGSQPSGRSLSNPNYNTKQNSESNSIYSTVPGIRFNTPYSNPITYAKSELKKLKAELKPMRNKLKGNNRDSRLGNIVSNKRIVGMNNAQIYKFMTGLVGQKPGLFRSKKLSNSDKKVIRDKIISLRTKANPLQFVKGLNNESQSNSGYINVAGEEDV